MQPGKVYTVKLRRRDGTVIRVTGVFRSTSKETFLELGDGKHIDMPPTTSEILYWKRGEDESDRDDDFKDDSLLSEEEADDEPRVYTLRQCLMAYGGGCANVASHLASAREFLGTLRFNSDHLCGQGCLLSLLLLLTDSTD